MAESVAAIILRVLKRHKVKFAFGLPAAQIGMIMDGLGKDPDFTYLTTRHEEACGHMAHAIGKVTDGIGVCFATVGPGATNMVPGVAAAWADNIPVIVLTPNNPSRLIYPSQDMLQNADQIELYKAITKWQAVITYPDRAEELIERAIQVATSGRPGPVHLDIACDILTQNAEPLSPSRPILAKPRPVPSSSEIEAVAELMANAKRPLLLAGGGVVRSDGVEAFRALAKQTGFATTTTAHARGTADASAENYFGSGGVFGGETIIKAAQEADVIVAFGCKFASMTPVNKPPMAPLVEGQKIVQIDIDADAIARNVPTDIGLVGDARETLLAVSNALEGRKLARDESWLADLMEDRKAFLGKLNAVADGESNAGANVMNEAALARAFAGALPDDAIVSIDGGQIMEWAHSFVERKHPKDMMFVPGMGHLGFGLPAAIAAKLAHPDRPVVCITGDGAMGMTGQELETAVRYNIPVVTLVANDSHWGMYRPLGEMVFENDNFGTKLTDVDFVKVAEGYGAAGEKVDKVEDIGPALKRGLESGKVYVIDVLCDFTSHPIDFFWPDVIMNGADVRPV